MQRIGLVGFGFIGKTHLEAYRSIPNAEVRAICTRSKSKELKNFPGIILEDYEALLARDDIDVIDICVPTFLHEEYVMKAARAKKHVICEKPLALTVEAVERIVETVKEEGVRLFVGHVLRFWPEYQMIKGYTASSELNKIETIHAKRLGKRPTWSDWFQYPEKSGGALFDLHIHDIDFVYYLLGDVQSVYATGRQNKYGAWDQIMTTLTFERSEKAFVEASHRMPSAFPFTSSFWVQSKQNVLDFQLKAGENIEVINERSMTFYQDDTISHPQVVEGDAFVNELTYFVDCLEKNQVNEMIPLDDVRYVIKLMKAIETSLITGKEVEVM